MKLRRWMYKVPATFFTLVLAFGVANAHGDITVTEKGKTTGPGLTGEWTRTLSIKGLKMRVESSYEKERSITIYDLEAGKRIRLLPERKQAIVMDLGALSKRMTANVNPKSLTRVIRSTGKKSEILGESCDEYTFELKAQPSGPHGSAFLQHDTGTVCVSQSIPGGVEFTKFVHEAKKRGYSAAAFIFSPSVSPIGMYFYGDEPNVTVLSAKSESGVESSLAFEFHSMTSQSQTMSITAMNSDAIPDEVFEIPADWKIKKDDLK